MRYSDVMMALAGSVGAWTAGVASAGGPAVTYRVVAKTGDVAPGGGAFTAFGLPRMNEQGEVAFGADTGLVVFSSGIWSEGVDGPGALALVAREGTAVPGSGNTLFIGDLAEGGFTHFGPEINDRGHVAFGYRVVGAGVDPSHSVGVMRQVGGALQNVARPLQIAAGIPGATFEDIASVVSFSDQDEVALRISLAGAGVNALNNDTIWRMNENGSFSLVMREGAAVPGQAGFAYTESGPMVPLINDAGQVSFVNDTLQNGDAFWTLLRGAPGAPVVLAREGQPTPLGPTTALEGGLFSSGLHTINNNGDALFPQNATVGGVTRTGLWRVLGGALQAVAVEGQPSPLGNTYSNIDGFNGSLGQDGRVVFRGRANTGGALTDNNNSAIFVRYANGATEVIAREGDLAPGLLFGATYDELDHLSVFEMVNERGQVLYNGYVEGAGVNNGNDLCLWGTRRVSGPTLMLREGQTFQVAPGDFRIVSDFDVIIGRGSESGARPGFNRLGQAALRIRFSNGTEAIVVATLENECFADIDGDLDVDFADLNLLLDQFNAIVGTGDPGDLDLDGDVDFADLNLLLGVYNTHCAPL